MSIRSAVLVFATAGLLLLPLSLLASAAGKDQDVAQSLSMVKQAGEGEIRVLYVPASGWAYKNEAGELVGVTIELMEWFAEWVQQQHDIELSVAFIEDEDWSRFYQRVVNAEGGVFGIGNVTITEERRDELAFSPPYLTNVAVLFSDDSQQALGSMDEIGDSFEGLSGLAFEGTLHEQRMRDLQDGPMPELDIALASSNDEIIQRVADGEYFAWIDAYNFWRAREAGYPLRHHPVGDDPGEEFAVIMPRGSDWENLIREFFESESVVDSDRWGKKLREHLGPEVAELLLDAAD